MGVREGAVVVREGVVGRGGKIDLILLLWLLKRSGMLLSLL